MKRGTRAHFLTTLALFLTVTGIAQAQAYGRVTVTVTSDKGAPLQGVQITVTSDELARFKEEAKTNKKGRATISFTDATKTYNFHFEYEDFQPASMMIKPTIRKSSYSK